MKKNVRIGLTLFLLLVIPAALLTAQEKKSEQMIKIVVSDKDGTKVIIDTLINGGTMADSIKLKDGEVIYLAKHGTGGKISHTQGGKGEIFVTYSSDNEGDNDTEKKITVISTKDSKKDGRKTYDVKITTDEKGNTLEKTKYVIAKDGMVVTIEGNDEAKAKELVNEIQAKLGINKEDRTTKKIVKEESKKSNKK